MKLSESDIEDANSQDVIRDRKLQFVAAHAEVTKRLNKNKKSLNSALLNMHSFDVNIVICAEADIINDEQILEILKKRFVILFPDQKLDILD
jgi:hypothetical protein